jgi:hypothetical protein
MRVAVAAFVFTLGILATCFMNHVSDVDVCTRTGMIRFTQTTGPFRFSSVQHTALSRVLIEGGYRSAKDHHWVGAWSGGTRWGSVGCCALGDGDLLRQSIESTNVATLIELMIANNEGARCEKWLGWIFDPETSHFASNYAWGFEELTNKSDLLRWLDEREAMIVEDLAIVHQCGTPLTNQ